MGEAHRFQAAVERVASGGEGLGARVNDQRYGYGYFFRRQLYSWSTNGALSEDLAQVVAQVCAEVLAPNYPDQALVRLHHIFRNHPGPAGETARTALRDLISDDPRLYSLMLDRVTREARSEGATRDPELFLEFADPAKLADIGRDRFVVGWRAALTKPSPPHCDERLRAWLVACEDNRLRERLLDVLIEAADGRYDALNRLHVVAHGLAERIGIADQLRRKIDAALGIDSDGKENAP